MDECKPLVAAPEPPVHVPGGRAVQVDTINPALKAPGSERLKLKYEERLSNFAFKSNLRRCMEVTDPRSAGTDWSCFVSHRLAAWAYTCPLFSSTQAISGTKYTQYTP